MVTLQIVVTENCNLGCSYCYMKNRNTILSRETFMDFYRSLPSNQEYTIDFFGGEPLMNFDMVKFITETVSDDPRFTSLTMPSNGLLLTQEIVDFIKSNNINYSWSCDGLWEENIKPYINKRDLISQVSDTAVVMFDGSNHNFTDNHKFFLREFGVTPDFRPIREGWTPENASQFSMLYGVYTHWVVKQFKRNRIRIPNHIYTNIKSLYAASRDGDEKLKCIDGQRICLMPDGSTGFCARMCTDGDNSNPEAGELYNKCESCTIKLVCEQGCYHMVNRHGIDDNLCRVYCCMVDEHIKLNHHLRDDVVWKQRYIGRIFYDTGRNV